MRVALLQQLRRQEVLSKTRPCLEARKLAVELVEREGRLRRERFAAELTDVKSRRLTAEVGHSWIGEHILLNTSNRDEGNLL